MGGWWCDKQPALMRGADLPFSVKPSQGPTLPSHLLGSFSNWITQGCNAIDHFQYIGEILWKPELKKCFEDHAPMYTSVGRYHVPKGQVAALYSNRINNYFGFPWANHLSNDEFGQPLFRGGSYPSSFNSRGLYSPMENILNGPMYESDAVTELSFVNNRVGKYRVVVDTDTAILDEDTINGMERYVRAGGIFVTCGETGRHSPQKANSWPIDRLTGFQVVSSKPDNGNIALTGTQTLFPSDWVVEGNVYGLRLKPSVPDAQTVMTWKDGETAIGLRQLGKGYVITVGPWFYQKEGQAFYAHLFQSLKLDPIPARLETSDHNLFWRHFLSNNGLYDVWVVRNGKNAPATGTLLLADGWRPAWAVDLNSGVRSQVHDGRLPVNLPPQEMAMYITPRSTIADSTAEWFNLQRGWWQGTGDPGAPFAKQKRHLTVDLCEDWKFQPVDAAQKDVSAWIDPKADDSSWEKMSVGVFALPNHPAVKHYVVRKHFRVPDAWKQGRTLLRLPEFRGVHNRLGGFVVGGS